MLTRALRPGGGRRPFSRRHRDSRTCRGKFYGGQCSRRSCVIVRRLLHHQAIVSRRALLGGLGSLTSALALGGCASLGATGARFDASTLSVDPTLLVATTRKRVNGAGGKPWVGPGRACTVAAARAKLGPPDGSRFSFAPAGPARWRPYCVGAGARGGR